MGINCDPLMSAFNVSSLTGGKLFRRSFVMAREWLFRLYGKTANSGIKVAASMTAAYPARESVTKSQKNIRCHRQCITLTYPSP
jgi:hypothetical protein